MNRDRLTGRSGQAVALALTLVVALCIWAGLVAPLLSWHQERDERLAQRREVAKRMAILASTLPALQHQADSRADARATPSVTLEGASDAIAGAMLQERLQALATAAEAALASIETLPVEQVGVWRRIGLRASLTTSWPVLVRLLQAIEQATPKILVDDLRVQATLLVSQANDVPLQTSLTVYAFRVGQAPGAPGP